MRVAMTIERFAPVIGGAQRQIEGVAPELERRGVEVSCVTSGVPGAPPRERFPGLDVVRVRAPERHAGASFTARGTVAVARLRPDLIHAHSLLSPSTIGLLAGRAHRVPVVAKVLSTGRGGDVDRLLRRPLGRSRLRAFVRRFAAFVSLSPEIDIELREWGVMPDRIWRIPNGVDADRFRPARNGERQALRRQLGVAPDEPLVLYCGRFEPVKRLDALLEAFAGLPGRLLLVGEGSERDRVRDLILRAGLGARVVMLPAADDTAPLHRAADVYASASETEGMSGAVLEAMASGVPVVASPASGMAGLVGPCTGALADDTSADALRVALATLIADGERRQRAGEGARRLVSATHSIEATAARLHELYEDVIAQQGGK